MLPNIYLNCEANCCEIRLLSFVMPVFTLIIFSIWVVITRPISAATAMSPSHPHPNIWPRLDPSNDDEAFNVKNKNISGQNTFFGTYQNPILKLLTNDTLDKTFETSIAILSAIVRLVSFSLYRPFLSSQLELLSPITRWQAWQAGAAGLAALSSSQH